MTIHLLISGKVQRVGYREFTRQKAIQFDLQGWVRNREDGTVEALASGTESNIQNWIEQLKRGPALARVNSVDVLEPLAFSEKPTGGFEIRH